MKVDYPAIVLKTKSSGRLACVTEQNVVGFFCDAGYGRQVTRKMRFFFRVGPNWFYDIRGNFQRRFSRLPM